MVIYGKADCGIIFDFDLPWDIKSVLLRIKSVLPRVQGLCLVK